MTCDLSSLWQRFGRGGRGEKTQAVAILLAEKKYFDEKPEEEKEVVVVDGVNVRAVKRKRDTATAEEPPGKKRATRGKPRAADQSNTSARSVAKTSKRKKGSMEVDDSIPTKSKRPRLTQATALGSSHSPNPNSLLDNNTETSTSSDPGREGNKLDVEAQRKVYHEAEVDGAKKNKQAGKVKRDIVVGSAIDDFINAKTREGLTCRRDVLNVYFDNDKSSKFSQSFVLKHMVSSWRLFLTPA